MRTNSFKKGNLLIYSGQLSTSRNQKAIVEEVNSDEYVLSLLGRKKEIVRADTNDKSISGIWLDRFNIEDLGFEFDANKAHIHICSA